MVAGDVDNAILMPLRSSQIQLHALAIKKEKIFLVTQLLIDIKCYKYFILLYCVTNFLIPFILKSKIDFSKLQCNGKH